MGSSTARNTDRGSYSGGSGRGGANESAHDKRQKNLQKNINKLKAKGATADSINRLTAKKIREAKKFELKTTGVEEGRRFVQERLGLENKQSGTGFYGENASAATNKYLELAGVAKHSKLWNELKYGISGGAMGSGDPTGVLSSIPISNEMLRFQNKMKTGMGLAMSMVMPGVMALPAKALTIESSANLLQPKKAHEDYMEGFSAKQTGKKFTSDRNLLGILGLKQGSKTKSDTLG